MFFLLACKDQRKKVSICVTSLYTAQVAEIQGSSFLERLISQEWNENAVFDFESGWQPQFIGALEFVACVVSELLCNEQDAKTWIGKSKFSPECHQLLVLRLFVDLCLLCVN